MDLFPSLIPINRVLKVSEEILKTENVIKSRTKSIKGVSDLKCRIDLRSEIQHDEAGGEKKMLAAFLTLLNIEEDTKIGSNFVFCIKSAGFLKYEDAYYTSDSNSSGIYVCSLTELLYPENKFIVDGELVVEMKGIIFLKKNETKTTQSENGLIERLWKDEEERDFKIVVKKDDGRKTKVKVHKMVLALRSPVFQRMLKTDMKEKQEEKVEIIDFDLDTVQAAVAFCYDQQIFENSEWQQLIALHRFADKYDIEDLKRQTELYLAEAISFENVCDVTNAVTKLNAPKLQEFCLHFLLLAAQERIPVKDINTLENEIAVDLLKKSFSIENC